MRLATFSKRHVLEFASNRVRFTVLKRKCRMHETEKVSSAYSRVICTIAVKPGFLCMCLLSLPVGSELNPVDWELNKVKRPKLGETKKRLKRGRLNAYRKPVDPQAAYSAGQA